MRLAAARPGCPRAFLLDLGRWEGYVLRSRAAPRNLALYLLSAIAAETARGGASVMPSQSPELSRLFWASGDGSGRRGSLLYAWCGFVALARCTFTRATCRHCSSVGPSGRRGRARQRFYGSAKTSRSVASREAERADRRSFRVEGKEHRFQPRIAPFLHCTAHQGHRKSH